MTLDALNTKEDLVRAFTDYNVMLYRYIFLRVGYHKETAQDLTQEVFLKAWSSRESYRKSLGGVKNWLYRIAHNLIIDFYRTHKVDSDLEAARNEIGSDMQDEDDRLMHSEVIKKLSWLNGKERDLIVMRYVEELELTEIAETFNTSYDNIKVAVNRAINKLKGIINETN